MTDLKTERVLALMLRQVIEEAEGTKDVDATLKELMKRNLMKPGDLVLQVQSAIKTNICQNTFKVTSSTKKK